MPSNAFGTLPNRLWQLDCSRLNPEIILQNGKYLIKIRMSHAQMNSVHATIRTSIKSPLSMPLSSRVWCPGVGGGTYLPCTVHSDSPASPALPRSSYRAINVSCRAHCVGELPAHTWSRDVINVASLPTSPSSGLSGGWCHHRIMLPLGARGTPRVNSGARDHPAHRWKKSTSLLWRLPDAEADGVPNQMLFIGVH